MSLGLAAPPRAFFSVPLDSLEPATVLGFDLFLRYGGSDPVLYRDAALEFTADVQRRLLDNGVREILVPSEQAPAVFAYCRARGRPLDGVPEPEGVPREVPPPSRLELELDDILIDDTLPVRTRAGALLGVSRSVIELALSDLGAPGLGERVRSVAESAARFLLTEQESFGQLVKLLAEDMDAYNHAVRCGLYAAELARAVGWGDMDRMSMVARAAMLHDVGRGSTPLDLLHRTGGMSDQEWADVLRHPARGVEILRRADFDDPVSCDVVLRHHERCDGSGFPDGQRRDEIPFAARLVAIVDIFDALTSSGKNRSALSGYQALWRMTQNMAGQFDPSLLEAFIRVLVAPGSP